MSRRLLWTIAACLLALPLGLRMLIRAISSRPAGLGITQGRLAACPTSPNCVSSETDDTQHAIEPLTFNGAPGDAFERLRKTAVQSGGKLITAADNYLHFEFTTPLLGFIDDVEFRLEPETNTIHFRSASRLGHSDLGTNRRRMEAIRQAFAAE